jgi:hypothetical protein
VGFLSFGANEWVYTSTSTNKTGKSILAAQKTELPVAKVRFTGQRPFVLGRDHPEVEVVNVYLNAKDYVLTIKGATRTYPLPKSLGDEKRHFYFVAPEFIEIVSQSRLLDPIDFLDGFGYSASFDITPRGELELKTPETLYDFQPQPEMVLAPGRLRLYSDKQVFLPKGRGVTRVLLDGKPLGFAYDSTLRELSFRDTPYITYLGRGDGRKTIFSIAGTAVAAMVFVDEFPTPFSISPDALGTLQVILQQAPRYGAIVKVMPTLPKLQIQKEPLRAGTWVMTDPRVMAKRVDLSRFPFSSYDSVRSDYPVYLEGQIKGEVIVASSNDVYLGSLSSSQRGCLAVDARLLFLAPTPNPTSLGRLILSTDANSLFPLQQSGADLRGTFVFKSKLATQKSSEGIPGPYSDLFRAGQSESIKILYDESFVSEPFYPLVIYRLL